MTEEAKWSTVDIWEGTFPVQECRERAPLIAYTQSEVRVWVAEPVLLHQWVSGATAVFLGPHQHFTVQFLLFFFKGIFYLSALQSSIPAEEREISDKGLKSKSNTLWFWLCKHMDIWRIKTEVTISTNETPFQLSSILLNSIYAVEFISIAAFRHELQSGLSLEIIRRSCVRRPTLCSLCASGRIHWAECVFLPQQVDQTSLPCNGCLYTIGKLHGVLSLLLVKIDSNVKTGKQVDLQKI